MFSKIQFSVSNRPNVRFAALLALTTFALLPFVDKAVHIEDTLFVRVAEQIIRAPLDPFGFELNWYGQSMPVHEITKNPPLASYWMAIAGRLFGFREWVLHLWFMVPALAAIAGVAVLARRFCKRPELAALMTLLTPGFLVSASTLMCDVLMLAFFVWALHCWMKGIDDHRPRLQFASAALIVMATLSKYFGIALIPLCAAYALLDLWRQHAFKDFIFKKWLWTLPLAASVVPLLVYEWATRQLYGHGLLSEAVIYANSFSGQAGKPLWVRLAVGLCFAGGSAAMVLFFLPIVRPLRARWRQWLAFGMVGLAGAYILGGNSPALAFVWPVQIGVWSLVGAAALWLVFVGRDPKHVTLALWGLGSFAFAALVNWSTNVRSVLPLIPAVAIAIVARLDARLDSGEVPRSRIALSLALSAILSFWVAQADFSLASANRTFVQAAVERDPVVAMPVRFQGHWGFQYYAENAGANAVERGRDAGPMRLLIPLNNSNLFQPGPHRVIGRVAVPVAPLLSKMNRRVGAGFYAGLWGALPFAFGTPDDEVMMIIETR